MDSPKYQKRATPIGKVFKHLVVIGRSGTTQAGGHPIWKCQCDCGRVLNVISSNVRSGGTTSCGCRNRNHRLPENQGVNCTAPEYRLWSLARSRSKAVAHKTNTPLAEIFSIKPQHILIPKICPILGLPLFQGKGHARSNSPSLDRKNPQQGYTPENIQVISYRANMLKNNATIQELELILAHVRTLQPPTTFKEEFADAQCK